MEQTLTMVRNSILILCMIVLAWITTPLSVTYAQDEVKTWPSGPEVNAEGAVLLDADTGITLYEKNAKERFYPASTTKIMTCLLAFEQSHLTDIVTTPKEVESRDRDYQSSSRVGFVSGETLTMEEVLYGTLLHSGNDAALSIASHVGNGDIDAFVNMMNARAEQLGCVNTHFTNPHGLHDAEHYSSPYDLALMMQAAIKYKAFCDISNTRNHEIPATNKKESRWVKNTHRMINGEIACEGLIAGKTGMTDEAQNCMVTVAERNGRTLICVVMKVPKSVKLGQYSDTTTLLDYGFSNFVDEKISVKGQQSDISMSALFGEEDTLVTAVSSPINISATTITLPKGASVLDVDCVVDYYKLPAYNLGENVIGKVQYYYGGKYLASADVIFDYDPAEITALNIAKLESVPYVPYVPEPESNKPRYALIAIGATLAILGIYYLVVYRPYHNGNRHWRR